MSVRRAAARSPYLGSTIDPDTLARALTHCRGYDISDLGIPAATDAAAELLAAGAVVGWIQGRAKFGPRALGNRSITRRPPPHGDARPHQRRDPAHVPDKSEPRRLAPIDGAGGGIRRAPLSGNPRSPPGSSWPKVPQSYFGPVVLVTDARCYSATDIFAAGFQDHGIGLMLGTDGSTGAGGANVWQMSHLLVRSGRPATHRSGPCPAAPI